MANSWIFAHRGFWNSIRKQNSSEALAAAIENDFSIETDIRDSNRDIVIAHDAFVSHNYQMTLVDLFINAPTTRYALNLKSDGLCDKVLLVEEKILASRTFVFDGSIPQMYHYRKQSIPHALRLSEFESELPWTPNVIWIDSFLSDWWLKSDKVSRLIETNECVFVSPELHGRDHRFAWDWVVSKRNEGYSNVSICTDYPLEILNLARE